MDTRIVSLLKSMVFSEWDHSSGQIIVFHCHQPRFPWKIRPFVAGFPYYPTICGPRSCEVAIICPDSCNGLWNPKVYSLRETYRKIGDFSGNVSGGRNISLPGTWWPMCFFKLDDGFQIFTMEKCLKITISLHPFRKLVGFGVPGISQKLWQSFSLQKPNNEPSDSMEISKKLERYGLQGGVVICQQTLELRWLPVGFGEISSWLVATSPPSVPGYPPKKIQALLRAYENHLLGGWRWTVDQPWVFFRCLELVVAFPIENKSHLEVQSTESMLLALCKKKTRMTVCPFVVLRTDQMDAGCCPPTPPQKKTHKPWDSKNSMEIL